MADYKSPTPRRRNSTSPVILMAIVILGLIVGAFYYFQELRDQSLGILPPDISSNDKLEQFNTLQLNFAIFDNPKFRSLKIFGESPVRPDITGKNNLFAPF